MARKSPPATRRGAPKSGEPGQGGRGRTSRELARDAAKGRERKVDEAVDMTFPASDPPAAGGATGTEPPSRPVDRKAPVISKEDIERAAKRTG